MDNCISFLHHTPKLRISVKMVQFLSKLLLKQRFLAVHHDSHYVESEILERSESDILPPTPKLC